MKMKLNEMVCALAVVATLVSGCGKGSAKNPTIPGVDGPHVNFINGTLTLSAVLQNVTFDAGLRAPIPKLKNSYIEIGPDFQSAGLLISIGIDKEDMKTLTHDVIRELDPKTLPGGRPIPGVAAGTMPSLAVEIPKLKDVVFYVGPTVIGTFVHVPLKMPGYMGTFRFYDAANVPIGNVSIVGEDDKGENSGFLVLVNLKGRVEQVTGMKF
ncbi:MAG: hypothetical protein H7222_08810 [Methylotenera sp.]|nr:hypothetical protein [Oligoflexia bacterium]